MRGLDARGQAGLQLPQLRGAGRRSVGGGGQRAGHVLQRGDGFGQLGRCAASLVPPDTQPGRVQTQLPEQVGYG